MPSPRPPRKSSRLARHMRILFFLIPALSMAAILIMGSSISRDIADDAAVRMSRQYAIEAAANFQTFMNPHMRMMQQMAHSTAIARWLANEDNPEAKATAFETMMGYAVALPYAYYMFTVYDTWRGYNFYTTITVDEFAPWGRLSGGDASQWFFDTLEAELPFVFNIQRTRPDEDGNWWLYIWSNHRIYYQGRVVGVFTLGSPFSAVFNATFGGFDTDNRRGYLLDQYGMVRLDSTGILETEVDGIPVFPTVPEIYGNPGLVYGISNHLRLLQGGRFPLGTPTYDAVRLERGAFRYASISPIVETSWSIMVLSAREGGLTMRYMPIIVTTVLSLASFVVLGGLMVRRLVLTPLKKLSHSTAEIGRNFNANIYGSNRDDEIGDISQAIQNVLRQISDLREKEQVAEIAQQTMELTRKLVDSAPVLIELWEADGSVCVGCNKYLLNTFELSNENDFGDNWLDFSAPIQPCGASALELNKRLILLANEEGYSRREWLFILPSGEELPADSTWIKIEHYGKSMIIAYSIDLRPIKAAIQAQESNKAKGRFLARMSHEIRTPLSAVLGIAEIQLRGQNLSPMAEEGFAKIYDSSKTLLTIVNDILDFSKIESGKMPLLNDVYDVAQLVANVAQLHLVYVEHKNLSFQMRIDPTLPTRMKGDVVRIRQIINNLLTNAFKYTPSGTVTLSLHCEADGEDFVILIISIQDTGNGMSQDQIDAAKGEYIRLHDHERSYVSGTGLGLPIVYNLAQMMDASIQLTSEVGKGTFVTVRVPQKIAGTDVLGQEMADKLQHFEGGMWAMPHELGFVPKQMPHGRVLVVDDVDTNLYVVEAMLESFGLNIELCENGQDAIDKIAQGKVYDVIFMDYMMPDMDGMETTRYLRDMGYTRPIVALTANAIKGQAERFMENGFSGFMTKPVDMKILNSYLMRFVG